MRRLIAWAVAVVGMLGSLAFGYTMAKEPGVFWTRVQARFLPPDLDASNAYRYSPLSMVLTAAAVGKAIDNSPRARMADADVLLTGEGVNDGYRVQLPNTGGQWANQFISPYLDVQVVGPSPDGVTARTEQLLHEIDDKLKWLQDEAHASPNYRITMRPSPISVSYQKGSSGRAGVVSLLIGLGLTSVAAWLVGRDRRQRGTHYVQHPSVAARMRGRATTPAKRYRPDGTEPTDEAAPAAERGLAESRR